MNMKMASILCLVIMLAGCVAGQQRGLVGDTYVSSSQPALALKARDLPLMGSMTGASRLTSSGAMGGLLVDSWVTVYGKGDGASPLAIVAHGEVPNGWYWDGIMRHPFSINEGVETIGGVGFQACTYVTSEKRDAFLPLEDPEGARILAQDGQPPRRWLARMFANRFNFDSDKIVLEYREPLPEDIDLEDSGVELDTLRGLLGVDTALWRDEVKGIREFYQKFGDRLPRQLSGERDVLDARLN